MNICIKRTIKRAKERVHEQRENRPANILAYHIMYNKRANERVHERIENRTVNILT